MNLVDQAEVNPFLERVKDLPFLGIGVSTEYGAFTADDALDLSELHRLYPAFAGFLEVGVEVAKGLDADALAWVEQGRPTTYHFLDINLDEPADQDHVWLSSVGALIKELRPAWMCGDAGLWHFGPRDRGHMLLLPPILSRTSAEDMAEGIRALRTHLNIEVLPENPPGHVYIGDLHLLDFFGELCELADTGMLLDVAHLALYQNTMGYDALEALDRFPLERIVEVHIAGASAQVVDGLEILEDDHTVNVLPETWQILEWLAPRMPNLRAVVFECERNRLEECVPGFRKIADLLRATPFGARAGL